MPFDVDSLPLGKTQAVHDKRALLFSNYLKADILPYIPQAYHWGAYVPHAPMYANDRIGDCTIAAALHHEGIWTFKNGGKQLVVPDSTAVSLYSTVGGYVPGDPSTDNGASMLDVMKLWKSKGLTGKDNLLAYVSLEPGNRGHVMASTFLFGGVYLGIQLPNTAKAQCKYNGLWSLTPGYKTDPDARPGSWGGHCVALCGYNQQALCVGTWNWWQYISWPWYDYYVDEAFTPLSSQWMNAGHVAPNQFNLMQLVMDLSAI